MHNHTATKVEQAAAEAVVSREKKFKSSSIFLGSGLVNPQLDELVVSAEDENELTVILIKRQRCVAFQFYS